MLDRVKSALGFEKFAGYWRAKDSLNADPSIQLAQSRLRGLFLAVSAVLILVVSALVLRSVYSEKVKVADTFLSAARLSLATGDLRQAGQLLQGSIDAGFTRLVILEDGLSVIEFREGLTSQNGASGDRSSAADNQKKSLIVGAGEEFGSQAWWHQTMMALQPEFRVMLDYKHPTTHKTYIVKFYYGVFQPLGLVLIWLLPIFGISYLVFKRSLSSLLNQADLQKRAEQNKALAQLAWQVAHDLKSPLSVLSLSISDPTADKQVFARNAIKRIDQLVGQLLSQSRGSKDYHFIEDRFFPNLITLVEEKNFEFQNKPRIKVQADERTRNQFWEPAMPRSEFFRVLSNLINNSKRALENKWALKGDEIPAIELSLKVRGEVLILQVKDQGMGIAPEILSELGQRRITTDIEGCGLGLYTAIKNIEKFGGDLKIQSEPGQFTSVQILLPVKLAVVASGSSVGASGQTTLNGSSPTAP